MMVYVLKRLLQAVPVVLGVMTLTFILMYLVPGDPVLAMVGEHFDAATVANLRRQLGLDDPWPVQYIRFMGRIMTGDLGRSFLTDRAVAAELLERIPYTLELAFGAMTVSVVVGLTVGIVASLRPGSLLDRGIMVLSLVAVSAPVFWVALLLILYVGVGLRWLPPTGYGGLQYLILPAIALGTRSAAFLARITRANMLEVLGEDYIRTARAKGLSEWVVVLKHALRNALIPIITVIGTDFGSYLSGAVLTESVFGWPGVGRYALDAILKRDFPAIQGAVLFMALIFIAVNLAVDLLYGWIDPRIRLAQEQAP
ncbi:MAG: ABC transporter permease [Candidatus Marinimicrobia bacterium]|nr:ABC transporter permease [Candidatus Neomarinimicrobiota bacterium]